MKDNRKPAFPKSFASCEKDFAFAGLTKREYFAVIAMQGILSNPSFGWQEEVSECASDRAIHYADELLKQLES